MLWVKFAHKLVHHVSYLLEVIMLHFDSVKRSFFMANLIASHSSHVSVRYNLYVTNRYIYIYIYIKRVNNIQPF